MGLRVPWFPGSGVASGAASGAAPAAVPTPCRPPFPVAEAEASSNVPQSTPTATAKIETIVATRSSVPATSASPATWVRPMSPSAPGPSNQKPGRKDAFGGHGRRQPRDPEGHGRHDQRTDEGADVAAEDGVPEHLTAPRRVQDDQQAGERPRRRGVRDHHPDREHEHAEPRRPVAEEVAGSGEHLRRREHRPPRCPPRCRTPAARAASPPRRAGWSRRPSDRRPARARPSSWRRRGGRRRARPPSPAAPDR